MQSTLCVVCKGWAALLLGNRGEVKAQCVVGRGILSKGITRTAIGRVAQNIRQVGHEQADFRTGI